MTEPHEPTEEEIRAEIARNEAATVKEIIRLFEAMAMGIFLLPLFKLYIDRADPLPVFEAANQRSLSRQIEKIISQTLTAIHAIIQNRSIASWKQGEALCFASLINKVPESTMQLFKQRGAFLHREQAATTFLNRTLKGLKLSDRVWKMEPQIRFLIETTLQTGIADGKSALETAQSLKQYLRNPDALFRRVRDESGKLQLSKAAREFHPGQGVYRSAHANAMRLARSEINNSYRAASMNQARDLDFVTGFKIQLSKAHVVYDICDSLAGIYPKDFVWHTWHPQCRCHVVFEIISPDQFVKMENGTFTPEHTTQYPPQIGNWLYENHERFKEKGTASGVPWIEDNPRLLNFLNELK